MPAGWLTLALALLLTACAPPAVPASQPAADPPAARSAWALNVHEGIAGFGPEEADALFQVTCDAASARVTLESAHTLPHDQSTTMTIRTAAQTFALPARSHNDIVAVVVADVSGGDPAITALVAAQESFVVEVEGAAYTIPWSEMLPQALNACRG